MEADDAWRLRAQGKQSNLVPQLGAAVRVESISRGIFRRVHDPRRSGSTPINFRPLSAAKQIRNKLIVEGGGEVEGEEEGGGSLKARD